MAPKIAQQIQRHRGAWTAWRVHLRPRRAAQNQARLLPGSCCPASGTVLRARRMRSNSRRRMLGLACAWTAAASQRSILSGTMHKLIQFGGAMIGACTCISQRRVHTRVASSGEMSTILGIGSRVSYGSGPIPLRARLYKLARILRPSGPPGIAQQSSRARFHSACGRLLAQARHEARLSRPLRGPCWSSGSPEGYEKDVRRTGLAHRDNPRVG
mmetsp:Transcript_36247/g.91245  ORF Transcript_36247/g.91245 Transcript_36247/m.91245 type:complete len:214 (+) Transcript_36247:693-1334(+)